MWITLALALAASPAPGPAAASEAAMLRAWQSITGAKMAKHVEVLASDAYEGREPGSAGEEKTLRYLEAAFRAIGAEPGAGKSYRQDVPLVELKRTGQPSFSIEAAGEERTFAWPDEFVASMGKPADVAALGDLPVTFVGHGITAPEFEWDDYAKADVKDGAILLLRGDADDPSEPERFRGIALTTHGLSLNQYENAARHGARAAIVVHTDASAGYPWTVIANGRGSAQNFLADAKAVPRLDLVIHVSEPAARKMLAGTGLDLDSLIARSTRRGFSAIRTPLAATMSCTAKTRAITSHNVIAKLLGSGAPDEAVIFTGHWDHVGRNDSLPGTDKIFNGAIDNATGTAAVLEIARAWASLPARPRRTAWFVATTAEEKGLLGSEYLASHPIVPLAKTAAVLNLDALFPFGEYATMAVTGFGASELEDTLALACRRLNRVLQDDSAPQVGAYYRSDHYPFAKRGVPALFAVGNPREEEMAEDSPLSKRFAEYLSNGYHKVTDEYDAKTWDMRGPEGDARAYFETGWRVARSRTFPQWRPANEFRKLRDEMMRGGGGGAAAAPAR